MNKLLLAGMALGLIAAAGSASAADMPVKAPLPPVAPAPGFNWSGFYVGGNIGYGWGNANSVVTLAVPTFPVGPVPTPIPNSAKPDGIIGGAQIGYNWQPSGPWVLGAEADWQGSGQKGSGTLPPQPSISVISVGTINTTYNANIASFGTVRGRVGYSFDRVLLYATGGLAYGEVKISGTSTDSGIVVGLPYSATGSFSRSHMNAGWTLGGGIEGAFAGNWSWKAEYLYLDLGSLDIAASGPFTTEPIYSHTHFTDNVIRAGLNYRFGAP
jgi:outer membrane immunogenic protein